MNLFYTPSYAKTGDVIPFFTKAGRFEGYYLKNWNPDAPKNIAIPGWYHIVSEDNRSFREEPANIPGGTGSVLEINGEYHVFYCTFDDHPQAQWARHAVSKDLVHWTDIPEDKFGPDGVIYRMSDWRDPFVFRNEETDEWWMILAARENTPYERNGCTALCVSKDLSHWEYRKPLYSPHLFESANECPDLFKLGDWYYLVYSNYTDGFSTYYCMSKSLQGPWIRPALDTFDSRAFYAAKTGSDGINRYIYGWNPTRGENGWKFDPGKDFGKDYASWNWGGSIVVHRLIQHENGTLGVQPVEAVANCWKNTKQVLLVPIAGQWENISGNITSNSPYEYASVLGDCAIPEQCHIQATMQWSEDPKRFGIALQVDEHFDFGYYLMFEPNMNRIEFRSGLRMYEQGGQMFPYASEMERLYPFDGKKEIIVDIYVQGTMAVMYVNRDYAFGFRMYNYQNRKLGFFADGGKLHVSDVTVETEE